MPAKGPEQPRLRNSEMRDTQDSDDSQECEGDENELWQEIGEDGRLSPSLRQPAPVVSVPDPKSALEATALLSKFRPARCTVEDLQKLLDARADPNIALDIHPLMKVMTFANKDRVGAMREALLRAGATESDEARERWKLRRCADACEESWLRNFHCDPR